ncbi:uncharacterized protein LOC126767142, partial [Bactrocera neohumeralis]|uniref:uncharacterized protein LOC126767142 n=1 Tax=Bactrocera neohumeralis TaxID=98809 RepID=UPI0021657C62
MAQLSDDEETTSSHKVGFSGSEWIDLYAREPTVMLTTFREEASAALGLSIGKLHDVRARPGADNISIYCDVAHPNQWTKEMVQQCLVRYTYPNMWALAARFRTEFAQNGKETDGTLNGNAAYSVNSNDSQANVSEYRILFEGALWHSVLAKHTSEMETVADVDVDNCLQSHFGNQSPTYTLYFRERPKPNGAFLHVRLHISSPDRNTTQSYVDALSSYNFPAVWNLFNAYNQEARDANGRAPETASQRRNGTGNDVRRGGLRPIVANQEEELEHAFALDVSEAMRLPFEAIRNQVFEVGSVFTVRFDIEHPASLAVDDIKTMLENCAFARIWEIYQHYDNSGGIETLTQTGWEAISATGSHGETVSNETTQNAHSHTAMVNTRHRTEFPGDHWDIVYGLHEKDLRDAFVADARDFLGAAVRVVAVHIGSLVVDAYVRHSVTVASSRITELLADAPYTRLWRLYYETVSDSPESGTSTGTREAGRQTDTQRGLPLTVVSNGNADTAIVTTHVVRLEGDDWAAVLSSKQEELEVAVSKDIADATGLPPGSVSNMQLTLGSLVATFDLAHEPSLPASTIDKTLSVYDFPLTQTVRQEITTEMGQRRFSQVTTSHVLHLDEDWTFVVNNERDHLEAAIVGDVCELFGLPLDNVSVKRMIASSGLRVEFEMQHDGETTKQQINEKLQSCGFSRTWALLERNERNGSALTTDAATSHRVTLEGDWASVLRTHQNALQESFTKDVCATTCLPRDAISGLTFSLGSLVAEFSLHHGSNMTQEFLDDSFKRATFPSSRALQQSVAGEGNTAEHVVSRHRVRLDGNGWKHTYGLMPTQVESAFREDVSDATGYVPQDQPFKVEPSSDNVVMDFYLGHPSSVDSDSINSQLANCVFPKTRELYVDEDGSDNVVTSHTVRLEGDDWDRVVSSNLLQLQNAFKTDVAETLSLPLENVSNLVFSLDGLQASFDEQRQAIELDSLHDNESFISLDNEEADVLPSAPLTKRHPRSVRTTSKSRRSCAPAHLRKPWSVPSLCRSSAKPSSPCTTTRASSPWDDDVPVTGKEERESALPKEDDASAEQTNVDLKEALRTDVAHALGVSPSQVRNIRVKCGSLIASFEVANDPNEASNAEKQTSSTTTTSLRRADFTRQTLKETDRRPSRTTRASSPWTTRSRALLSAPPTKRLLHPCVRRAGADAHAHGHPEEAVERAVPVQEQRQAIESLHDNESFISLDNEEPTAALRAADEEAPALRAYDEQEPTLSRTGTPEEAVERAVPVQEQRQAIEPLHDNESFMSLDDDVPVTGKEERECALPSEARVDRYSIELEGSEWYRVIAEEDDATAEQTNVDLKEALRTDVAHALGVSPSQVRNIRVKCGSLIASFEVANDPNEASAAEKQTVLDNYHFLRRADFTRQTLKETDRRPSRTTRASSLDNEEPSAALRAADEEAPALRAYDEQEPTLMRTGTPEEAVERAVPVQEQRQAIESLHDNESFISLDNEEPTSALRAADEEAPALRAYDEQEPTLMRTGTPEEAVERAVPVQEQRQAIEPLHDNESFISLDNEEPTAALRAADEEAPAL